MVCLQVDEDDDVDDDDDYDDEDDNDDDANYDGLQMASMVVLIMFLLRINVQQGEKSDDDLDKQVLVRLSESSTTTF